MASIEPWGPNHQTHHPKKRFLPDSLFSNTNKPFNSQLETVRNSLTMEPILQSFQISPAACYNCAELWNHYCYYWGNTTSHTNVGSLLTFIKWEIHWTFWAPESFLKWHYLFIAFQKSHSLLNHQFSNWPQFHYFFLKISYANVCFQNQDQPQRNSIIISLKCWLFLQQAQQSSWQVTWHVLLDPHLDYLG